MPNSEGAFVVRQHTSVPSGLGRWFLVWSIVAGVALLLLFFANYRFSGVDAELYATGLRQPSPELAYSLKQAKYAARYVPWVLLFFLCLLAVALLCRQRWLMPFPAILPLLLAVGILFQHGSVVQKAKMEAAAAGSHGIPSGHKESTKQMLKNCADTVAQLVEPEPNATRKQEFKTVQRGLPRAINMAK